MRTISNSKVNDKYVLVLKENGNHSLVVEEHPIEDIDYIETEINAVVENPEKTLYDLYSKANRHLDYNKTYSLCYPYEYDNAYINEASSPERITVDTYKKELEQFRNSVTHTNRYKNMDSKSQKEYLDKCISDYIEKHYKHEYFKKKEYASQAIRFIKCQYLSRILEGVENDPTTRMFSTDSIGWTSFKYSVSDDVQVIVSTNFLYGVAAYFHLAVKYKDMMLIPYSDLVNYYYANMQDLISYTRSYVPQRDSWYFALNYVANFVNESRANPNAFIRKYVLSEIEEMMKGLRATIKNPGEMLSAIKDKKQDYISMRVIRPFEVNDERFFSVMPSEAVSVFKAEKISGALMFLESLDQIKTLCPEVIPVMEEVIVMNKSIEPEILKTLESIVESLKPLESELKTAEKERGKLSRRIEVIEKHIKPSLAKITTSFEREAILEEYAKNHPEYVELKEELRKKLDEIDELVSQIRSRKRFKERMEVCLERIKTKCVA